MTLLSHAHDGGAVTEISLPARGVALGHVLTRRTEGYHEKFRRAGGSFDGSTSIHDVLVLKDPSVLDALGADPWQRASFREAFHGEGDSPEAILRGRIAAVRDGREGSARRMRPPRHAASSRGSRSRWPRRGSTSCWRRSLVLRGWEEGFMAAFRLRNRGGEPVSGTLCSEWNLNMLSGRGGGTVLRRAGGPEGAFLHRGVVRGARFPRRRRLAQRRRPGRARPGLRRAPAARWKPRLFPRAGAEKIHQGICIKVLFPVSLAAGKADSYSVRWMFYSVA